MGNFYNKIVRILPSGAIKTGRNISRKAKYFLTKPPAKKRLEKIQFEVHLTDHCNLNCKGCGHFSPLVKEGFADLDTFKRDMEQMAAIFHNEANHIFLVGGEPLLHPEVSNFLKISRKNFPKTRLVLITNGVLLPKMNDDFWNSCKNNNIEVSVTKYPISFDYDKVKIIAEEKKVNLTFFGDFHGAETLFYNISIDCSGKTDREKNFNHCNWANDCIQLVNGKLYTCVIPAYYNFFSNYFNIEDLVVNDDYIDIYSNESDAILNFLSKSIPFCKFCNMRRVQYRKWGQSKKEINEWMI